MSESDSDERSREMDDPQDNDDAVEQFSHLSIGEIEEAHDEHLGRLEKILSGHSLSYKDFGLLKEILFVTVIAMAQFLTQAGLAQAIAPLHYIGNSFNVTNAGELSWFAASYSLTVGTFILPAGRFGDLFGSRKIFIIGWAWFALWTLIAGFAVYCSSQILFHFCRALQGIGPAMLLPNGLALLGRSYPSGTMRKNMVFCVFGAVAPIGFLVGAVFDGIFAQFVWWPWTYWVGAMIMALIFVLAIVVVPIELDKHAITNFHFEDIKRLDPFGSVAGVLGLVLFNIAWNQGPVVGWTTPYTYVLLILGVLFFISFGIIEFKYTDYPILPMEYITTDTLFVAGCISLGWASFGIWIYYWWQISEMLRDHSILLTAAQQVPAGISGGCAAILTGYLLGKMRPQIIMIFALTAFCVGNILMGTVPIHQLYWFQTFFSMWIMPLGMDMSFPSATIIMSNAMPREHQGLAASLVNTVVNYSVSIGLGIAGTVESRINRTGDELLKGYRSAYYVAIGLSGAGIILAFLGTLESFHEDRVKARLSSQEGIEELERSGETYEKEGA
ncbi:uncharacterized protein V1516DRAFT_113622 [Lipomyces oligophaga]|uniref:uncharacterized protein n=1 Tax=Lipomyces oligophaga TaxID=45792 RepID=UPI0034CDCD7F